VAPFFDLQDRRIGVALLFQDGATLQMLPAQATECALHILRYATLTQAATRVHEEIEQVSGSLEAQIVVRRMLSPDGDGAEYPETEADDEE